MFNCDVVCSPTLGYAPQPPAAGAGADDEAFERLIKEDEDVRASNLYIDTTPVSTYALSVSICNALECAHSEPVYVRSLPEAPGRVHAPRLVNASARFIHLVWLEPELPSGEITGYLIRQSVAGDADAANIDEDEDALNVVYFGLKREYVASALEPLTNYSFSLEACNSVGCTRSRVVYYRTREMAPRSVAPPVVINTTDTEMTLNWHKPNNDELANGFLLSYVLYLGAESSSSSAASSQQQRFTYNVSAS